VSRLAHVVTTLYLLTQPLNAWGAHRRAPLVFYPLSQPAVAADGWCRLGHRSSRSLARAASPAFVAWHVCRAPVRSVSARESVARVTHRSCRPFRWGIVALRADMASGVRPALRV
jgi:hypothetical protein